MKLKLVNKPALFFFFSFIFMLPISFAKSQPEDELIPCPSISSLLQYTSKINRTNLQDEKGHYIVGTSNPITFPENNLAWMMVILNVSGISENDAIEKAKIIVQNISIQKSMYALSIMDQPMYLCGYGYGNILLVGGSDERELRSKLITEIFDKK